MNADANNLRTIGKNSDFVRLDIKKFRKPVALNLKRKNKTTEINSVADNLKECEESSKVVYPNYTETKSVSISDFKLCEYDDIANYSNNLLCNFKQMSKASKSLWHSNKVSGNFAQRNCECVSNAYTSIGYNLIKRCTNWTSDDMDLILKVGEKLYSSVRTVNNIRNSYLLVTEMPNRIKLFGKTFETDIFDPYVGFLSKHKMKSCKFEPGVIFTFEEALKRSLTESTNCFVTFASNTMSVIHLNANYVVFNSHSLNEFGLPAIYNGKSFAAKFENIDDVSEYFNTLSKAICFGDTCQFEITGVNFRIIHSLTSHEDVCNRLYGQYLVSSNNDTTESMLEISELAECNKTMTSISDNGDSISGSSVKFLNISSKDKPLTNSLANTNKEIGNDFVLKSDKSFISNDTRKVFENRLRNLKREGDKIKSRSKQHTMKFPMQNKPNDQKFKDIFNSTTDKSVSVTVDSSNEITKSDGDVQLIKHVWACEKEFIPLSNETRRSVCEKLNLLCKENDSGFESVGKLIVPP
ncbi:Uncharacterised protein r2_g4240 [Pycnogonum litorale]